MSVATLTSRERLWRPTWVQVLCTLFFLSGFPALIYQLTWQRALFRLFGINVESVTIVVTAFMVGLGLGAIAGGRISRFRSVRLLPLLATIEILTAAYGVVSLQIFDVVGNRALNWSLPSVAVVSLLLVSAPTLLMGATLPILVAHLVRRSGSIGSAVGLLYYVNTLGAGVACILCAVVLFPFFGMQGAVFAAAGINGLVAVGALLLHATVPEQAAPAAPAARGPGTLPILRMPPVLVLAALGGFISLSYEIFLFRTMSYATGSSATAFATTLSAFLIGIAGGSKHAGEVCRTCPSARVIRKAIVELLVANVVGLMFLPLLTHAAAFGSALLALPVVMAYVIARFWGALLPYLAQFGIATDDDAGMRTSLLYLCNILGSAAGAIVTGFVLVDLLGLVGIAVALAAAATVATLVLIAVSDKPRAEHLKLGAGALVIFGVGAALVPPLSQNLLENLLYKSTDKPAFAHVVENRSGILAVTNTGTVLGNGMYDGRFNTHLRSDTNGVVRPYALSLYNRAPRDVLMIGLSSGSWAQVIANNPSVASLTVIELNPGYLQLIAQQPEVASVLHNPKVTIVTEDGRRWLREHSNRTFDAIVSNTTWHFRANASSLLSLEFLDLARAHLAPHGTLFFNTTESDRVQRTACLAFPYGARFMNHMVVSPDPIDWDVARWKATLASYTIDGRSEFDLGNAADRQSLDALASPDHVKTLTEACSDVLARTSGRQPITDDNMGTEWRWAFDLE